MDTAGILKCEFYLKCTAEGFFSKSFILEIQQGFLSARFISIVQQRSLFSKSFFI